jgi:hypothetical protein
MIWLVGWVRFLVGFSFLVENQMVLGELPPSPPVEGARRPPTPKRRRYANKLPRARDYGGYFALSWLIGPSRDGCRNCATTLVDGFRIVEFVEFVGFIDDFGNCCFPSVPNSKSENSVVAQLRELT